MMHPYHGGDGQKSCAQVSAIALVTVFCLICRAAMSPLPSSNSPLRQSDGQTCHIFNPTQTIAGMLRSSVIVPPNARHLGHLSRLLSKTAL